MVKMRLGEFLKCKEFDSIRSELIMKFLCHNICCLIQEMFERNVKIDFKSCEKRYVDPEEIRKDKARRERARKTEEEKATKWRVGKILLDEDKFKNLRG